MLLSVSPFESHQDLLSRGFSFSSFADDMSLPLDFSKQISHQDITLSIPPSPPAPVTTDVSAGSNKRKRSAPVNEVRPAKRVAPTPPQKAAAAVSDFAEPASPESDKKRNKLGYHRTSVACSHCRRRKIRCMIPDNDATGRCANCVRLKKECTFCPVDDSTQPRRPQTSSGVSAPGMLPSPEPMVKGSISHSISPAVSSSQARDMMPVSAGNGLGIFGAAQQGRDPSTWYTQMAGWGDKTQSNIFAATPLSAKSPHSQATPYGMPSPYSMPSTSAGVYGRPTSSMTPLSEDTRSTASFHGDFGWTAPQPQQQQQPPAGRSMSYMDNYAAHAGFAGAQSMMQPRRSMTLPSSTMAYPDPTLGTLSMAEASIMAPVSTGAQSMQWNTALWDPAHQTKDVYGQDTYAFDNQGNWFQGGSAPPF